MTNERTNAELIKAIRDEDKGLGGHAMLSARIIHNTAVVMQAAYIEQKHGKGADVAMEWITNHLDNCDCLPEEECIGGGNLDNANNPELFFRDNHLSGELSPYQSRMAPLIDELERRLESVTAERDHWKANHDNRVEAARFLVEREDIPAERVTAYQNYLALRAERDALAAKIEKLERQEPVAFWWIGPDGKDNGGPYRGKPSDAAIDNARNMGCEPQLLFSGPIPAPAVPYGIDEEAANRISLAVYDWEKGINPEPLLYAINRILATEAHPLSEEGQRALLQSATVEPNVSTLTLNAADSAQSEQEGMILMPVKADEVLVAGFVGCETREEAMLGWDVAVRMQEVRTGKIKPTAQPEYDLADEQDCHEINCMTRLIATDTKMKNPNCPREPIAKCVAGFCINEAAGRERCSSESDFIAEAMAAPSPELKAMTVAEAQEICSVSCAIGAYPQVLSAEVTRLQGQVEAARKMTLQIINVHVVADDIPGPAEKARRYYNRLAERFGVDRLENES